MSQIEVGKPQEILLCISRFLNRLVAAKDPPSAAADLFRGSLEFASIPTLELIKSGAAKLFYAEYPSRGSGYAILTNAK